MTEEQAWFFHIVLSERCEQFKMKTFNALK